MINVRYNIPVQKKKKNRNWKCAFNENLKCIRSLYIYYIYTCLKNKMCIGVSFVVFQSISTVIKISNVIH